MVGEPCSHVRGDLLAQQASADKQSEPRRTPRKFSPTAGVQVAASVRGVPSGRVMHVCASFIPVQVVKRMALY